MLKKFFWGNFMLSIARQFSMLWRALISAQMATGVFRAATECGCGPTKGSESPLATEDRRWFGREKLVFQRTNKLATLKSRRLVTAYFPGMTAHVVCSRCQLTVFSVFYCFFGFFWKTPDEVFFWLTTLCDHLSGVTWYRRRFIVPSLRCCKLPSVTPRPHLLAQKEVTARFFVIFSWQRSYFFVTLGRNLWKYNTWEK